MSTPKQRLLSSVGKKLVTGITGLALVGFLCGHLIGNLLIFAGPEAFNHYAHTLLNLGHGALIPIVEIGLIAFFLLHAGTGVSIWLRKRRARAGGYAVKASGGGPSRKNLSSLSMVLSGLLLFAFVVLHVIHFKYGPGEKAGYEFTDSHGETIRDLHRLVVEEFKNPVMVLLYVGAMVFLALHLRHRGLERAAVDRGRESQTHPRCW